MSRLNRRLKAEVLDQPVLVIESAKVLKSLNRFRFVASSAAPKATGPFRILKRRSILPSWNRPGFSEDSSIESGLDEAGGLILIVHSAQVPLAGC